VTIAAGLGEIRNALVVRTADVLIAVRGEHGTPSEIGLALKTSDEFPRTRPRLHGSDGAGQTHERESKPS
jgi:hypothetical protein